MQRTSQNGTYRLDRAFPGVGRITVASGATTKDEAKKRNALLTRLYDQGRLDLLKSIQTGMLSVTEVYFAARTERLDTLTGDRALLGANLWDAVGKLPTEETPAGKGWLPRSATALATRKRYATSFTSLERSGVLKSSA